MVFQFQNVILLNKIGLKATEVWFFSDVGHPTLPPSISRSYHKTAIDSLFSNKLYPSAPIERLVIFYLVMTSPGATKCSGSDSLSTLLTLFSSARDMSTGIM